MHKPFRNLTLTCLIFLSLIACKQNEDLNPVDGGDDSSAELHEVDTDYSWNPSEVVTIVLKGSSITASSSKVSVSGTKATITSAGTYSISGNLSDGQIIVNDEAKGLVRLLLNGVDISSSNSAPIYVKKAGKVIIGLLDNTQNYLTDGLTYVYDVVADQEPNAAVFSKSDLSIFGNGTLSVKAQFADGIVSKDGLIIKSGNLNVTAADDAIRGKDYLVIRDGNLALTAKADGLKSSNDEDATLGYVIIDKGKLSISAGDDGIHAESKLTINGGDINITKSYEGIESKIISVNDGVIHIVASDDGLNAAGGTGTGGGAPGTAAGNYFFYMNGGYIWMDAAGDGVDVNGTAEMKSGTIIVNGPTANNNAAIDYDGGFKIMGGSLIAVGSSGMAQIPGTSSTQYSVLLTLSTAQNAGTLVHLRSTDGKELMTFKPTKRFQSLAFSSADLKKDVSYEVYVGGAATGTVTDGLYQNSSYSSGTKLGSFTVTSVATKVRL